MRRRWFRIRWSDSGRARKLAMNLLDRIAKTADLSAVWLALEGNLALVVQVERHAEALLFEGLHHSLPHARVMVEDAHNVEAFSEDLDHGFVVSGPVPEMPPFPQALLDLPTDAPASARLGWQQRCLTTMVFTTERIDVAEALNGHWPGARVKPRWAKQVLALLGSQEIPPSRMMALPSSERFSMLASRQRDERAFAGNHDCGELLLGCDVENRPVWLQAPARLVWVGAPQRVDNVLGWMTQRWRGQVIVLDADPGRVDKVWQDVSEVMVAWSMPGQSDHINPLMQIEGEGVEAYITRVESWLRSLGITPDILGGRVWSALLVTIKLLVLARETVSPPVLLHLFRSIESISAELSDLTGRLSQGDQTTLDAVHWPQDKQAVVPADSILSRVLDTPEMILWFPPYLDSARLREARWVILRVPRQTRAQRIYWDTLLPLLYALYADRSDALMLALSAESVGGKVMAWQGDLSAVAWGASLKSAIGKQRVPPEADLLVGAWAEPRHFSDAVGLSPAVLAAQDIDQAEARIGGDIGSVRLRFPKQRVKQPIGVWRTESGERIPAPLAILGDDADELICTLLKATLGRDERVIIIGKRDIWGWVRRAFGRDAFAFLPASDLPMLNLLASSDVFSWIWWGRGLGIPAEFLQQAYRQEINTVQRLLQYAKGTDWGKDQSSLLGRSPSPESRGRERVRGASTAAVLQDVCNTGLLGHAESNPVEWFEGAHRLAVESVNPAVTRALAMAALEAKARIVIYDTPGIVQTDRSLLQRTRGLIYPAVAWIDSILITTSRNGLDLVLPAQVHGTVRELEKGQGYLYRRNSSRGKRVWWRSRN